MKLKIFKNIDLEKLNKEEKSRLKVADSYVQNHGKPVTRRQFLASGLVAGSSYIVAPTLLNVLSSEVAKAAQCKVSQSLPTPINLNAAGGWGVSMNVIPLAQDEDLLPSYNTLGLGSAAAVVPVRVFGAGAYFSDQSQFMAGIQSVTQATTLANTAMVPVWANSQDDTANNMLNIRNGLPTGGEFLPDLADSDVRNQSFDGTPLRATVAVNGTDSIRRSIGVQVADMSEGQIQSLSGLIRDLTNVEARRIASLSYGDALGQLASEAADKNASLVGGDIPVDFADNADLANLFNNQDEGYAAAVYNALMGHAHSAEANMGGYDYHGNNRGDTDQRDNNLGVRVGLALEAAALLQKPCFITVTTDGSVSWTESEQPGSNARSDSGGRSGILMIAYHPDGTPETTANQVGHFESGQEASNDTIPGRSPAVAVASVLVNYYSFSGRMDLLPGAVKQLLTAQEIEKVRVIYPPSTAA